MDIANKAKRKQYAVVGLVLIFGLILFNALSRSGVLGRRPPLPPAAIRRSGQGEALLPDTMKKYWDQMDANTVAVEEKRPAKPAVTSSGYTAQDLRDPFNDLLPKTPPKTNQPLAAKPLPGLAASAPKPIAPQKLSLSGIWWGARTRALINGGVYEVGDQVDGATVKRITPEGVTLEFAGSERMLTTANGSDHANRAQAAYRRR